VISTDGGPCDFVYDVKFASGRRTLRGSELKPVRTGPVSASFSCEEKTSLSIAHQKGTERLDESVKDAGGFCGDRGESEIRIFEEACRLPRTTCKDGLPTIG